jgi:hypothetical protein
MRTERLSQNNPPPTLVSPQFDPIILLLDLMAKPPNRKQAISEAQPFNNNSGGQTLVAAHLGGGATKTREFYVE